MKLLLILLGLIILINAETIINIHNNPGGCCHKNKKYHIYYDEDFFNGYGYSPQSTNNFDRAVWAEIMRRNPSLKAFIAPTNFTLFDFYGHVKNCDMDGFASSSFYYPSLDSFDLLTTRTLIHVYEGAGGYWTTFSNLARNPQEFNGKGLCAEQPLCLNQNFCSNYSLTNIADLSKQNNAKVHCHYMENTFFYDYCILLQKNYSDLGVNIELHSYPEGEQNYLDLLKFMSTQDPTKDIHIAIDLYHDEEFCSALAQLTPAPQYNLSLIYTHNLPNYPLAYNFCKQNKALFDIVNRTLEEMYNDKFICGLQGSELGFCLFEGDQGDPLDICSSVWPQCPTTNKKGDADSENKSVRALKKFLLSNVKQGKKI